MKRQFDFTVKRDVEAMHNYLMDIKQMSCFRLDSLAFYPIVVAANQYIDAGSYECIR